MAASVATHLSGESTKHCFFPQEQAPVGTGENTCPNGKVACCEPLPILYVSFYECTSLLFVQSKHKKGRWEAKACLLEPMPTESRICEILSISKAIVFAPATIA